MTRGERIKKVANATFGGIELAVGVPSAIISGAGVLVNVASLAYDGIVGTRLVTSGSITDFLSNFSLDVNADLKTKVAFTSFVTVMASGSAFASYLATRDGLHRIVKTFKK